MFDRDSKPTSTTSVMKRNTIQIMSNGFTPEQLNELIDCLEGNGSRCSVCDGVRRINSALHDRCTRLLLVATAEKDAHRLRDALHSSLDNGTRNIPIMFYLKQLSGSAAEVLMPE